MAIKCYKSNQRPHKHHKAKRNMLVVAIRLISPQLQIMNFEIKKLTIVWMYQKVSISKEDWNGNNEGWGIECRKQK